MEFPSPPISPLAIHFFGLFSRTEYALKRCKSFRTQKHGFIEPNWAEFAKHGNVAKLFAKLVDDERAKELIHTPPKYRILVNDDLRWSDQPSKCKDMGEVIQALKNLRNNFFHGEKGHEEDDHDRRLYNSAVFILNDMLMASSEVAANYYF